MAKFEVYTNQGEKITTTEHEDIKEALEYHSKLKQLPLDIFLMIFVVKEIKQNETRSIKN